MHLALAVDAALRFHTEREELKREWTRHRASSLLLLAALICGIGVAAAGEEAKLSGKVTMTATSAAAGPGWTWGHGVLTLTDGSEYACRISSLDVMAAGSIKRRPLATSTALLSAGLGGAAGAAGGAPCGLIIGGRRKYAARRAALCTIGHTSPHGVAL
jgi:hypothetical protein